MNVFYAVFLLSVATTCWSLRLPSNKFQSRITNGEVPRKNQIPWQAAVFIEKNDGSQGFCGGVLIEPEWILTAGQCVDDAANFNIQLGSLTLNDEDPDRVTVNATESFVHPDFSAKLNQNDIGLIKIPAVELTESVNTVNLTSIPLEEDVRMVITGFGKTADAATELSPFLQLIEIPVISNEVCAETYGDLITENTACAIGRTIESTCDGDTGGPAVADIHSSPYLAAIIGFISSNGCEHHDPSVYTMVYPYLDWIQETISNS